MAARRERRRLTKCQSELVVRLYAEAGGEWATVLKDERVAQWDVSRDYLATHLANRRKYQRRKARGVTGARPIIMAYRAKPADEWLVDVGGKLRWVTRDALCDEFGCACAAFLAFEEERKMGIK